MGKNLMCFFWLGCVFVLQSCGRAVVQACSLAVLRSCSLAVLRLCSVRLYGPSAETIFFPALKGEIVSCIFTFNKLV
jgi:hypothetical protein